MATSPVIPGYKALGGKTRQFLNLVTGEKISRRKYDEIRGIFYEAKAAANRAKDEAEQILRPAKGRKSAVKLKVEFKKTVAQARLEKKQQVEAEEKARKELAAKVRLVQRKTAKKVRVKKVRDQLLEAGRVGARIAFNTYEDYEELYRQIQKMGDKVFAYGLGITYIVTEERGEVGQERDVTVFTMMRAKEFVDKDDFEETMQADIESRSYLKFAHYWMHLKFGNKFAQQKAQRAGIKRNFNIQ